MWPSLKLSFAVLHIIHSRLQRALVPFLEMKYSAVPAGGAVVVVQNRPDQCTALFREPSAGQAMQTH